MGKTKDRHAQVNSQTRQSGLKIRIRGIVQGVGFRPFVFNLAEELHLTGWVRNTSNGVEIEANGPPEALQTFLDNIRDHPPLLARIDAMEAIPCPPDSYTTFEIQVSQPLPGEFLPVSPDMSICADCQRELFNPSDRRYRYPFINCTNCGPRYTIIKDIPYDRPSTTMAGFHMCPDCESEYHDPRNRRFHAQPVACPRCGPQISLLSQGQTLGKGEDALRIARAWLKRGKILAVKGLGGYHLACGATRPEVVAELRRRKKRSDKPFALMAFDLAAVERHCQVSAEERDLLLSRQRPIVLLERLPHSNIAAQEAAPNLHNLGVMLAYTPLHLLLLEPEPGYPDFWVMTSGNLSEEPVSYDDEEALARLENVADGFLIHNRPIHTRVDDSVLAAFHGHPYLIRRARGFAPDPVQLPRELPSTLAVGPELKNTFCLVRDRYAFLSQHIGDMENLETLRSFEEGIVHFERLFRIKPELIACDLHPNYMATRYAEQRARYQGIPLAAVQHHHAHLASCLADNAWDSTEPVIGLSFDGTGLGTDGAIWGSEVLLGGYASYARSYHLAYAPLPGGDLAVRKPSRMALAHLWKAGLDWDAELPPSLALCADERTVLRSQLEHNINCPLTSSMGRLFDAASALMGIRQTATYEGQAAIELEACADPHEKGAYEFAIEAGIIDPAPLWRAMLADWQGGTAIPVLSARFHNGVAAMAVDICERLRSTTGANVVALSGGVWQNRLLLEKTIKKLTKKRFHVLYHHQIPANDGGVAVGQAMVAAYQMNKWL